MACARFRPMDQVGTALRFGEQFQIQVQREAAPLEQRKLLVAARGQRGAQGADHFRELLPLGGGGPERTRKQRPAVLGLCGWTIHSALAGGSRQRILALRRGLQRHVEEVPPFGHQAGGEGRRFHPLGPACSAARRRAPALHPVVGELTPKCSVAASSSACASSKMTASYRAARRPACRPRELRSARSAKKRWWFTTSRSASAARLAHPRDEAVLVERALRADARVGVEERPRQALEDLGQVQLGAVAGLRRCGPAARCVEATVASSREANVR